MTILNLLTIPPLDPNLKTGAPRIMSGPVRVIIPTLDVQYGEFCTWMYVGVSGNVSYTTWDGSIITLQNVIAGVWQPTYSVQINSSGTTATGIIVAS